MYATLISLAGGSSNKSKPLDGLNVWPALSGGKPSTHDEIVYDIEPFRAALRQGDWKLIWQVTIPSRVELFNIAQDSFEKTNLAEKKPELVSKLKQHIEVLANDAVPPLFIKEAIGAAGRVLFTSVSTPDEAEAIKDQP